MLKKSLRFFRDAVRGPAPRPILSPADRIMGLEFASVQPTARLYARQGSDGTQGCIVLGPGAYLGRNVELATALGGNLVVGEDTSIQDNCVFHGDVTIGAHCLFGANAMMSTTIHRFRDHPHLLIRDQDAAQAAMPQKPTDHSCPIVIEDDCWIGWGVAIMPGTYIGRGAIIGANCVVTSNVGPYEIHGGVPSRKLGARLDFAPPRTIAAHVENDIPYFYRGFRNRLEDRRASKDVGILVSQGRAMAVLAGTTEPRLRIEGVVLDQTSPLRLQVLVNGDSAGSRSLEGGTFELTLTAAGPFGRVPGPLKEYTVVELIDQDLPQAHCASANRYAITSIRLDQDTKAGELSCP